MSYELTKRKRTAAEYLSLMREVRKHGIVDMLELFHEDGTDCCSLVLMSTSRVDMVELHRVDVVGLTQFPAWNS